MKRHAQFIFPILVIIISALSCGREAVKEQLPPRQQFDTAMKHYNNEDYLKSQTELQRLIYSFPGQTFIDTAQYHLAMSYYQIENYPESVAEFKRLLQAYPLSAFADDAQYYLSMSHYKESPRYSLDQTETYAAIDEFSVFLDKYPTSPLVPDAREKLDGLYDKLARKMYKNGELYLKLHDYEPALIYFTQVRDNYPSTQWAILAFYYSGEAQMKMGKSSDALETFENFVTAFPDHKLSRKAHQRIDKLRTETQAGG